MSCSLKNLLWSFAVENTFDVQQRPGRHAAWEGLVKFVTPGTVGNVSGVCSAISC